MFSDSLDKTEIRHRFMNIIVYTITIPYVGCKINLGGWKGEGGLTNKKAFVPIIFNACIMSVFGKMGEKSKPTPKHEP